VQVVREKSSNLVDGHGETARKNIGAAATGRNDFQKKIPRRRSARAPQYGVNHNRKRIALARTNRGNARPRTLMTRLRHMILPHFYGSSA
jgi:hypothetical protein